MDPYLSEIRLVSFDFAPKGWAMCNGQLMPINQNQALFSLLGTTYGGDGRTNFQLPNLQGRVILSQGNGAGLSPYALGETGGVQTETLALSEMPTHSHALVTSAVLGTQALPAVQHISNAPLALGYVFNSATDGSTMPLNTISYTGSSQPHSNLMPYLVLNYIIALQGIYPSRN